MALATIEPSMQAATLSGWPSMRAASSRMRSGFQSRPSSRSAITTPAVSAAALEPRPLPIGISLRMRSSMGGMRQPLLRRHRQRRLPDQILRGGGNRPHSRPSRSMESRSAARNGTPGRCPAPVPARRNPGPMFALEAGTRSENHINSHYRRPVAPFCCILVCCSPVDPMPTLFSLLLQSAPSRLIALSGVDMAIIAIYFVVVLGIGFYLKGRTSTGEDFFLAGREMTAWIAGLSFLSANLGSLELMGWAAAAYQYGILATHWYWIGAIPAMLFLGIVMMPFYYISKTHSVPGYLQAALRRSQPRASPPSRFALHDRADERHQHVLDGAGHEGRARLGHPLQHLGLLPHRGRLCGAGRAALGHLQRGAAVRADLGRRAADPHPRA